MKNDYEAEEHFPFCALNIIATNVETTYGHDSVRSLAQLYLLWCLRLQFTLTESQDISHAVIIAYAFFLCLPLAIINVGLFNYVQKLYVELYITNKINTNHSKVLPFLSKRVESKYSEEDRSLFLLMYSNNQ